MISAINLKRNRFEIQEPKMIIVTSPAKKLDYAHDEAYEITAVPDYLNHSEILIKEAKKLSRDDIAKMMKLSDKLADLNYNRYRNFKTPFDQSNARPAAFAFKGDTFRGLDIETLNSDDLIFAQKHYRIISGLYGLLRPLDLMQAYRLEMGTKFSNPRGKNLYEFWGDILTDGLSKIMAENETDILVNCASNEYFKAIKTDKLQGRVITPVFKQVKEGNAKMIGIFAKVARGMMTRYMIQNRITQSEALKDFNLDGYKYQPSLSDENNFEFHKIL
jgi:cytoplasmic iron level regulating protein YaaA (DUF328/UPF0246 family)